VAMWWLKPLFDRVPVYVLSRAVFGVVPDTRQVLRAPQVWAPGQLTAWLTWRRLDPGRALKLPVDLLEGPRGGARRDRVRVLQQAIQSPAWGLTLVGIHLELALFLSVFALSLLLVSPTVEVLPDNLREMATTFFETPPKWAQLCVNAVGWLATCAIEPFYAGAGLGLYLNRRTQLEAWDVELAFRRLAERAQALAGGALLVVLLALPLVFAPALPAAAQDKASVPVEKDDDARAPVPAKPAGEAADGKKADAEGEDDEFRPPEPVRVRELVGDHWREHDGAFSQSVDRAYRDPKLTSTRTLEYWARKDRNQAQDKPDPPPAWLRALGGVFALLGEFGLWLLAGVVLALLLWKLPRWLPWVRELAVREDAAMPVVEHADAVVVPLPDDVPAAVRKLWAAGDGRAALALLYRASVDKLANALGKPLPPGATEAECLGRSRSLPDTGRVAFAQVVRTWQAAAYAHRLPDAPALEELLAGWQRAFGGRA